MKILILTNVGSGLYLFRADLIKSLIKSGHEVVFSSPLDEYIEPLKALGCRFIETEFDRRGINPLQDLKLLKTYKKICSDEKPDVVLTYTIKPNIYGGLACGAKKIPYLVNVTGLGTSIENPGLLQKLALFLYRAGLRCASCVFFQNATNRDFFAKHNITDAPTMLLPGSGVNLTENPAEPYPDDDGTVRFLFVGRIMRDKGVDELLACADAVKRKYPNAQFDLAGDFDDEAYCSKVSDAVQKGIVNHLGYRTDIHALMAEHHAVIHPSYHEGLSNVLLEAAACGRPVIATDVPGCRETFDDGVSGIGVPAKDSGALIKAVDSFFCLPYDKKSEMGAKGREKVEREFDRQIVVDAYTKQIEIIKK